MTTAELVLAEPPTDSRARELWLQHAAGFIIIEDVRRYAMERIDPKLPSEARDAVQKGIDDTLYGLMMVMDGMTGALSNSNHTVSIDFIVRLKARDGSTEISGLSEVDLKEGDGMCMGIHGWLVGDFGKNPIVVQQPDKVLKSSKKNGKS